MYHAITAFLTSLAFISFFQTPLVQASEKQWQPPASFNDLPSNAELPDLFEFANGRQVKSADDWQKRRAEMKAIIQHYEYGQLPPRPDVVTVEDFQRAPVPNVPAIEERMTLVIGSQTRLKMRIAVYIPTNKKGPFPVIVREEAALGHLQEVPLLMQRGYLFVEYARTDLDPDENNIVGPAQAAYPEHDWATLAVWAWGGMRVVDYLESRSDVDVTKIGIVGHSRGGKMALLAGALDERFALVAANGSGCGGAGCYRIENKKCETLEKITDPKRFSYWFHSRLRQFADKEDKLPFDQHFLKALVAPRALICTEARGDKWANPLGSAATTKAAQQAFALLNAKSKNGIHFRDGNHDLMPGDWQVILNFADWHFSNKAPENPNRFRNIDGWQQSE